MLLAAVNVPLTVAEPVDVSVVAVVEPKIAPLVDVIPAAVTEPVDVIVVAVIEPALSTLKLPALTVSEPTFIVVSVIFSVFTS